MREQTQASRTVLGCRVGIQELTPLATASQVAPTLHARLFPQVAITSFRKCVIMNFGKQSYVGHRGVLESKYKLKGPNCLNSSTDAVFWGGQGASMLRGSWLGSIHRELLRSLQGKGASALMPGRPLITLMFYHCGLSFSFG